MTSRDFCYWLQGYFEIAGAKGLNPEQATIVQKHLAMVFKHEIDPSAGGHNVQAALNELHGLGGVGPNGEIYRC